VTLLGNFKAVVANQLMMDLEFEDSLLFVALHGIIMINFRLELNYNCSQGRGNNYILISSGCNFRGSGLRLDWSGLSSLGDYELGHHVGIEKIIV
jgi:hypothetical protein